MFARVASRFSFALVTTLLLTAIPMLALAQSMTAARFPSALNWKGGIHDHHHPAARTRR